jgi:hypothetical protein
MSLHFYSENDHVHPAVAFLMVVESWEEDFLVLAQRHVCMHNTVAA